MDKMKDQYGDKEGEKVYYATANKQGRDEKTFKKESIELLDDVMFENNGLMTVLPKGTILTEMAVSTGAIAVGPGVALGDESEGEKKRKKKKQKIQEKDDKRIQKAIKRPGALKKKDVGNDQEIEEMSNSQVSSLQQDH